MRTIPTSEPASRSPGGAGFAAGVFLASLLWLWLCGRALDYVADDALILFRHVKNHAAGLGMVWDRWHPVQAHSSVLWAYGLRLLLGLGIGIEPAARGVGLLAGAGCATVVAVLVRDWLGTFPALLAAAVAATFPPLVLWSSAGLETPLAAAIALLCILAVERRWSRAAALLLFCSPFVRPDLPLQLLCGLGLLALASPAARRLVGLLIAAAALGIAAYVAMNRAHYGAAVALPVATKLRIEPRNLLRFARYAATFAPQLALLWALLAAQVGRGRRLPAAGLLAAGLALGTLAELALLGGDELARGRFLCIPFLATLPALASVLGPLPDRRWLWPWAGLALLAVQLPWALRPEGDRPCSLWRESAGRWLHAHTRPTFTLAVAPAGFIPFYAERDTIDLMGLAHPQISQLPEPRGSEAWGAHATELAMAEGVCGVVLAVCDSPAEDPRVECPNPTLRGITAALAKNRDYTFLRSSEKIGGASPLRIAVRRSCADQIWGLEP